jgi:hypothetical protein
MVKSMHRSIDRARSIVAAHSTHSSAAPIRAARPRRRCKGKA